jgi:hypothetical protein
MSDTMLHGVLQMPPELWTNDAIDTAHRHSRYLEASKRIEQLEYERDEARMKRDDVMRLTEHEWLLKVACRLVSAGCKSEGILESLDEVIRERDQARRECNEAQDGLSKALDERNEAREELARVRRELVASNRGAEKNAKINQGLCNRLAEAERERDDAFKEWDLARDGWSKALEERDEARRERDEAMQMLGEQLYQRVNEWTEEVERLLGELNAAREEVSALKAKLDRVSQMNQHADKSSVGDSTYVLTEQPCQRASRVRNC